MVKSLALKEKQMQEYAVVKIAHKQYIVEPGKTYSVEKFIAEPGDKMDLEVLAWGKGDDIQIGKPLLDTKVNIEVVEQGRGEKIVSRVFKAKSRYRRTRGFKKHVTTFKVVSIK